MPQQRENDQGWTQYQKLVLAELERHDDRQSVLEKDFMELKLHQAQSTLEMKNMASSIEKIAESIKNSVEEMKKTKGEMLDQKLDLNAIKLKFGFATFGISTLTSAIIVAAVKLWLHA